MQQTLRRAVWLRLALALAAALSIHGRAAAAPGDLDPTFGGDGKVATPLGNPNGGPGAAPPAGWEARGGGKLATPATSDFALVRWNADSTLDATFGTGGKVTTRIGELLRLPTRWSSSRTGSSWRRDPAGRITTCSGTSRSSATTPTAPATRPSGRAAR